MIDRNRRVLVDRHDAVQMPRTADNVLLVDLSDEGVFKEHCLIGFPQPRGEACLEALLKQAADITEICRAKHCHWKVDSVPQPSQRSLGLRRKGILRRLGFRRFSVRPWGQRYRFGASLLVIGFFLPSPLRTGAQGKQQSRRQQQRAYPFAYSFHGRALRNFSAPTGASAAGLALAAAPTGRAALDLPTGGRLMGKMIYLLRKPESRGDVGVRGCFF